MSEHNVIDLLQKTESIGVDVWIDGGWGVDALLGRQTRPHDAVRCLTVEAQILYHQGYEQKEKDRHDMLLLCKTFGLSIESKKK